MQIHNTASLEKKKKKKRNACTLAASHQFIQINSVLIQDRSSSGQSVLTLRA